jgi:hypothetical protein
MDPTVTRYLITPSELPAVVGVLIYTLKKGARDPKRSTRNPR